MEADAAGAWNTLILMLAVPTLTLLICLAISWTVLRSGLRWRLLFDAVAFLPHAVPHLILAIAAMFATLFLLHNVFSLYGSLTILIFVYTVSRISFATRITQQFARADSSGARGSGVCRRSQALAGDAQDSRAAAEAGAGLCLDLDGAALLSRIDHGVGAWSRARTTSPCQ